MIQGEEDEHCHQGIQQVPKKKAECEDTEAEIYTWLCFCSESHCAALARLEPYVDKAGFELRGEHLASSGLICILFVYWFGGVLRDKVTLCITGYPGTWSIDQVGLELRDPPAFCLLGTGFKGMHHNHQLVIPV